MPLIAQFAADAASFSVRGSDGSATSFEVPWHRAVLTIEDEDGTVTRSAEMFVDGRLDVRGEGEDPHGLTVQVEPKFEHQPYTLGSVQVRPDATVSEHDQQVLDTPVFEQAAVPVPADDMAGQGFAALNPASAPEAEAGHEEPASEPEQGEVKP